MDCASPPLSPPSPGLARGWREGGGLLDLDCASPPLSPPSPGLARGWWEGGGLLDWTAPLCHPHRRPRAWPVGGGRGVDYWTWTTILRHPHRRPRGSFSTNTAPSWPLRLAGASFPTNGLPRRLDDGHRLLHITRYEADRLARCEAKMARCGKNRPTMEDFLDFCRCAQPAPAAGRRALHSAGLRPAPGLGWVSGGGALGARRLHLHHRLHSAGLRPAPGLGCREAVRWELAGSICTIGCTLLASAQHPTWQAPVARPAHSPLPPALTYGCSSSPPHPILLLPHTPFSISPHPSLPPPLASFSGTPPHTAHTHAPWSLLRRRPSSARPWYPPTLSDTINQAPPS